MKWILEDQLTKQEREFTVPGQWIIGREGGATEIQVPKEISNEPILPPYSKVLIPITTTRALSEEEEAKIEGVVKGVSRKHGIFGITPKQEPYFIDYSSNGTVYPNRGYAKFPKGEKTFLQDRETILLAGVYPLKLYNKTKLSFFRFSH